MPDDQSPDLQAIAAAISEKDRASRLIGIALNSLEVGAAELSMTVCEDHLNGLDVCHGGFIFSLADTAMAFASNSYGHPALAQMAQVTFLAPGRLGDCLTAKATEVALAGRTGIYDIAVRNQDGEMIAVFRGQTRRVKGKSVTG